MKRFFKSFIFVMALCLSLLTLTSCDLFSGTDTSKNEYWFNDYKKEFVAYNEETFNLDKAGTYWKMTVKKDMKVSIGIVNDSFTLYSGTYFSVNGEQVRSEVNKDVYTFFYKDLDLKKGDKLEFHAFWTNPLKTDDKGFTMSMFVIHTADGNMVVDDIK